MEKYSYNYDFLREWMEQEGVSVNAVKDALGVTDKNNIYFWAGISKKQRLQAERGEEPDRRPMPLNHILSLCNHFGIRLERFFLPIDSRPAVQIKEVAKRDSKKMAELQVRLEKAETELKHEKELRQAMQETINSQRITISALQEQKKATKADVSHIFPQ